MEKKLKVAFIYKKNSHVLNGTWWSTTHHHFFMHALKRNTRIDVTYFACDEKFDITKYKNMFDVILLALNDRLVTAEIDGMNLFNIPVFCGSSDPQENIPREDFHNKWKINVYFSWNQKEFFYKYYPKNFRYKQLFFGLEPYLFANITPFKQRIKDTILNTGAMGNPKFLSRIINSIRNPENAFHHYKLRTLCNKLTFVDYTPTLQHEYVGDKFTLLLQKYRASIAASTNVPVVKYFEIPGSGCLTFMEVTKKNYCTNLGYEDNKTAIFINEQNYKEKFKEYLDDLDNPKWETIAKNGREYAMKNFNNDKAVNDLVNLMEELIINNDF
jgi:hypothetical protein